MPPRLRALPDQPTRGLGMIRVSKERDGMVSPDVQRVAITDYAAQRGIEITGWLEGLDESGSRARSAWWPRLEQAVASVESGEYDVIVVWKFSRTARHRLRWAVALDRVETAGGRLESATEQVDTTTSTGRFTRGMLAELNVFEAERIGEVWREIHDRRIRQGLPATGKPKYGYAYDPATKLHLPDPVTGPLLADLYRRYTAGETVYGLVRWANTHGHRTTAGGLWSDRSLRRVLASGFAAGLFNAGGQLHQGAHEPLISPAVWQAYLDAAVRRRATPGRRQRSAYLLSGLVTCARCQHPMVAGQFGERRQPKYRCKTGKEQGPAGCVGGYITAAFVEQAVVDWLHGLAGEVDEAAKAAAATAARHSVNRNDTERVARQVGRTEEALTRLAVQNAETPLPASVYRAAYDDLTAQLGALTDQLEAVRRDARRTVTDPAAVAAGLLTSWDTTPVALRRDVLGTLLARAEVTTGRPRGTIRIVPVWDE